MTTAKNWYIIVIIMKIAVLDGHALNPGDLSWEPIAKFGELKVYDRTPPSLFLERAGGAEIALTNKFVFSKEVIDALPSLKYIGVMATGYNVVDLKRAAERGIVVTNIPAYSTESVVQTVFGLITECFGKYASLAVSVKAGGWVNSPDFAYYAENYHEMAGKTLGIVGYGKIGSRVATVARAFGMKTAAYNKGVTGERDGTVFYPAFYGLLEISDVVSFHCPLTKENTKMLDSSAIAHMKDGAIVINTARGPLIDEEALANALDSGKLSAAGLDVLSTEPPKAENPLLKAKNAFITPHAAWATIEARKRLMDIAANNIAAFLSGNPINRVN